VSIRLVGPASEAGYVADRLPLRMMGTDGGWSAPRIRIPAKVPPMSDPFTPDTPVKGKGVGVERNRRIGAIYRACRPTLLRLAARLTGSADDAEDLIHDVFTNVWAEPVNVDETCSGGN